MSTIASQLTINYQVQPGGQINGAILVPGDKSISHRSIMFGALANGTTKISGFLQGEDSLATLKAFRDMGVIIYGPDKEGNIEIQGVGMHGLSAPENPLDLGNSGTSMRLLTGLLSAQNFDVTLVGDESLSTRPMKRVVLPVKSMGAVIETDENYTAPLKLLNSKKKSSQLKRIAYQLPVASAQVKSCLLLAGMYAYGKTCVTEPMPTRDHTERMLESFGYPLEIYHIDEQRTQICIEGGYELCACELHIPADISSAAFFIVAATIAEDSELTLKHVGINASRIGIINILNLMGADISLHNEKLIGTEPVADLVVKSAELKGVEIPEAQVPLAIDEFPAIAIAASCAKGQTKLSGAEELRVKESDRIQAMVDGLQILGVNCEGTEDGMIIEGMAGGEFSGGIVDSQGDHRIAMSFVMAALKASDPIKVLNCNNVNTSFPGFVELAARVGISISTA